MLILNQDFALAMDTPTGFQLYTDVIVTSSDIKAEARRKNLPFKIVADSYFHLGVDDNGNNYYVKPKDDDEDK